MEMVLKFSELRLLTVQIHTSLTLTMLYPNVSCMFCT